VYDSQLLVGDCAQNPGLRGCERIFGSKARRSIFTDEGETISTIATDTPSPLLPGAAVCCGEPQPACGWTSVRHPWASSPASVVRSARSSHRRLARRSRARLASQPGKAFAVESIAPQTHGESGGAQLRRHRRVACPPHTPIRYGRGRLPIGRLRAQVWTGTGDGSEATPFRRFESSLTRHSSDHNFRKAFRGQRVSGARIRKEMSSTL
jgi:hypothetical protein